jgi:hypothetical protein
MPELDEYFATGSKIGAPALIRATTPTPGRITRRTGQQGSLKVRSEATDIRVHPSTRFELTVIIWAVGSGVQ